MTSNRRTSKLIFLLLSAFVVVNCSQLDARPDHLDLLEPLASATRRQHAGHLTSADKRSWRKNRVRVWGKRSPIDDDEADKRTWHENTVRVWGKRQSAPATSRRAWAGNTIRVWGKRHSLGGSTPEQVLDAAASRYRAAPKRSISSGEVHLPMLSGEHRPARLTVEPVVDVGTLTDDLMLRSQSGSSSAYPHHSGHGSGRVVRVPRTLTTVVTAVDALSSVDLLSVGRAGWHSEDQREVGE